MISPINFHVSEQWAVSFRRYKIILRCESSCSSVFSRFICVASVYYREIPFFLKRSSTAGVLASSWLRFVVVNKMDAGTGVAISYSTLNKSEGLVRARVRSIPPRAGKPETIVDARRVRVASRRIVHPSIRSFVRRKCPSLRMDWIGSGLKSTKRSLGSRSVWFLRVKPVSRRLARDARCRLPRIPSSRPEEEKKRNVFGRRTSGQPRPKYQTARSGGSITRDALCSRSLLPMRSFVARDLIQGTYAACCSPIGRHRKTSRCPRGTMIKLSEIAIEIHLRALTKFKRIERLCVIIPHSRQPHPRIIRDTILLSCKQHFAVILNNVAICRTKKSYKLHERELFFD